MEYHRSKEKRLFKRKKEEWSPGANTTEGLNKMRAKTCHLYLNE